MSIRQCLHTEHALTRSIPMDNKNTLQIMTKNLRLIKKVGMTAFLAILRPLGNYGNGSSNAEFCVTP